MKLLLLLPIALLASCATLPYGDELRDMSRRVEFGVGFAVKDGYIYGPFRGRLRPTEVIHPEAEATGTTLKTIEGTK